MVSSTTNTISDKFWFDDPGVLLSSDKLTEFFPHKSFSLNEKLNSFVRLALYISIILILYYKNIKWGIIFIFFIILTYYIHTNMPTTEQFELVDVLSDPPQYTQPINIPGAHPFYNNTQITNTFNGDDGTTSIINSDLKCTEPTLDNPFMNMTMKDYLNYDESGRIRERPNACDTADPQIKKAIDNKFNNNLFKDVNDVFGKFNSERQFHTMPWTDIIPDINGDFKNWLYKTPKTCKEDQDYCLLYEDIRSKRPVPDKIE